MKATIPTVFRRRVILAAVRVPEFEDGASLEELRSLTRTAGGMVVGTLVQNLPRFHPATLLGSGKVEELKALAQDTDAGVVVFDNSLSPAQVRNLEKALERSVMDRAELILDIFATRAVTKEARLQVELARLQYMLPRLVGRRTSMEQIQLAVSPSGAVAAGRGPGERQIEYDRRVLRRRIFELHRKIEEIEARRERLVARRASENFTVCLTGYTNAGKSTLMNALTGADALVENRLFSTLDTRTRTWTLRNGLKVLLSDTVGFIRRLPPALVKSFHATLEEVRQADLLLHVADASDPEVDRQLETVRSVLRELGCESTPTILVLNKLDALPDRVTLSMLQSRNPDAVFLSARTREGIERLEDRVLDAISDRVERVRLRIPLSEGKLLTEIRTKYAILGQNYTDSHALLDVLLPKRDRYKFEAFMGKSR